MPPRNPQKQFDARQAREIGERVRILLGNESVIAFAKRLGISRQWLHDILSGRVSREASVATLSSIGDIMGYSWEWLMTGRGMPNDQWGAKTMLVSRFVPQTNVRKKIILAKVEGELVLVPTSFLDDFEANISDLGVIAGKDLDMRPFVGPSDEILVDLKDHKLVNDGLFIAQVRDRVLACRAIKAHSVWLLSPEEYVTAGSLIGEYRILGRIRLIWKRV
jgi:transcriptional regulator with XRE-family HTH domain